MKKSFLFILVLMLLELAAIAQNEGGNNLTVVMENFNSDAGQVMVGLYNSEGQWLKSNYKGEMAAIENKTSICVFKNVPNGDYAVSIIHDENDNKKMDVGYFGIPKEPYACSRGAKGTFGPPKWEDAKFSMDGSDQEIILKF